MNADQNERIISHCRCSPLVHGEDFLKSRGVTEKIIGVFYAVYNELGFGFLEALYETAMTLALEEAGLKVQRQVPIDVWFMGRQIGQYKVDLVVNGEVLLELKAVRNIDSAFEKQVLNYLRATDLEVGLLLNFGHRPEFRRFVFENRAKIRVHPR